MSGKSVLFTHKSEMLYLEHARVYLEDGRVLFTQDREVAPQRFNFPHRNAQLLALGTGTSITNKAARKLAEEGVVLVFTGDKGMPLVLTGVLDYHPNEYAQGYLRKWMSEPERLSMAKTLMLARFGFTEQQMSPSSAVQPANLLRFKNSVASATSLPMLTGIEGDQVKNVMFRLYAEKYLGGEFKRARETQEADEAEIKVNSLLNHGNSLAYALAAGVLWYLGIPSQFPLLHGQTRNGGLILDVADLIKDGIVTPWAFESGKLKLKDAMSELRYRIKKAKADVFMMDTLASLSGGDAK